MIKITNEDAASEAMSMSRDLFENAMSAFAGVPASVDLRRLLAGVNVDFREAKADRGTFRYNQPFETVEVSFEHGEAAGASHEQAIKELTRINTAELANGLTAAVIDQRREALHDELAAERERISRPLRYGWLLPGAKDRRQAQRDGLTRRALATLDGVPLSGSLFDEALASVLKLSGSGSTEHAVTAALKERAVSRRREFETRRETILVLAWEAITAEDGGADIELGTTDRSGRFARAKSRARAVERKAQEERIRAAEQKRNEESRIKQAQIAREQERRHEWEEKTRPRWNPDEPESNDDFEFGG